MLIFFERFGAKQLILNSAKAESGTLIHENS